MDLRLTPRILLEAYRLGTFPMAESRGGSDTLLVRPGAAWHHPAGWVPPVTLAGATYSRHVVACDAEQRF